jgi:hypothetical protein
MNRRAALLLYLLTTAFAYFHPRGYKSQGTTKSDTSAPASPQWPEDISLFPVKVGDVYGYMDKTGQLILAPKFGVAEFFHEGLAQVYVAPRGGKWTKQKGNELEFYVDRGFIDPSGKIRFRVNFPENEEYNKHFLLATTVGDFSDGRAVVEIRAPDMSSKEGYIDTNGGLIIGATFDHAETFSNGLAAVEQLDRDLAARWGFIDPDGQFVIRSQFSGAKGFSEGVGLYRIRGLNCGATSTSAASTPSLRDF